jgi:hypothetical protein
MKHWLDDWADAILFIMCVIALAILLAVVKASA